MKNPIPSLTLLAAALAFGVSASAQPALNVVTIDLAKTYESYWETQANEAKLRETFQKAEKEAQRMQAEGAALVEQYKATGETSTNSMLTQEARDEASAKLQPMASEIQAKQQELQQFVANTQRQLEQRRNTHQAMMMDKIKAVANEIGRAQGATLIIDTSGPTAIGLSSVLYADPAYDITDRVMAELEKTKPAEEETEESGEAPAEATESAEPAAESQ